VPERIALLSADGPVSFKELDLRSSKLAAGLYAQGIRQGDHIGIYLMNGPEFLESYFAIIKIGAVPFNINYRYGYEELLYLFDNASAKGVIYDVQFSEYINNLIDKIPTLEVCISVGNKMGLSYKEFRYHDLLKYDNDFEDYFRSENDYILQYTGGTTGLPKGVMWPHKNFFFACLGGGGIYAGLPPISMPDEQGKIASDASPMKILPCAPLMHGAAMWTALSGILGGMTIVLDPMKNGFNANKTWDKVEHEGVNIMQIVGDAMAIPLLNSLKSKTKKWDLSNLVHLGSGGAVFSRHIKAEFKKILPKCTIADGMGTSETGISGMGSMSLQEGIMQLPLTENQQVIIDDRIAGINEIGYLAKSGYTPIGYYGDELKSKELFKYIDGKTWVLTGDSAKRNSKNTLVLYGRGSTCINTGGEKVYPEEVEEILRSHPSISDAAVVGVSDAKWGELVCAVISLTEGFESPSLSEVKTFCAIKLAGYKCPRKLRVVSVLKRSPAGKQDYKWVRSVLGEGNKK
jgi:fatty-acyl-CoA synthase